jgi:hypothetical protein
MNLTSLPFQIICHEVQTMFCARRNCKKISVIDYGRTCGYVANLSSQIESVRLVNMPLERSLIRQRTFIEMWGNNVTTHCSNSDQMSKTTFLIQ